MIMPNAAAETANFLMHMALSPDSCNLSYSALCRQLFTAAAGQPLSSAPPDPRAPRSADPGIPRISSTALPRCCRGLAYLPSAQGADGSLCFMEGQTCIVPFQPGEVDKSPARAFLLADHLFIAQREHFQRHDLLPMV